MSVATPNAVPQPRAGGQPPNPRPRREAGFGGRVARREGMFPAARHPSPISRDDRRSLPPRVLSRQARQGSAAPTATPRRRARTRRRRQPTPLRQPRRRARVALALDPPPTTSHARTPTLPSPIRRLTIHRSDPIIPRIAIRTSDPRNFTDRTISPSLSHWTTGLSIRPVIRTRTPIVLDRILQIVEPVDLELRRQRFAVLEARAHGAHLIQHHEHVRFGHATRSANLGQLLEDRHAPPEPKPSHTTSA